MQLNPARGRKLHEPDSLCRLHYGLCSSTPRGDGNPTDPDMGRKRRVRFMQLNPARGRKLARHPLHHHPRWYTVYAAQPREGTETGRVPALSGRFPARFMQLNPARGRKLGLVSRIVPRDARRFMQLNPARGRKLRSPRYRHSCLVVGFMQLNPARGRKHAPRRGSILSFSHGLCSSTPRGDGNANNERYAVRNRPTVKVYAAQPREGTETLCSRLSEWRRGWFMQLNPARGRKRNRRSPLVKDLPHLGLCILTPRGDESGLMPHSRGMEQLSIRTPTTTPPPCSSPVAAPHAQHISSFLMGGLW